MLLRLNSATDEFRAGLRTQIGLIDEWSWIGVCLGIIALATAMKRARVPANEAGLTGLRD